MQNECLLAYCRTRSIGYYSIIAAHEAINSRICLSCSQKAAKHLVIAMRIMELSHRFRNSNAVGTIKGSRTAWAPPSSHRFRNSNAVGTRPASPSRLRRRVASLPKLQRCWHSTRLKSLTRSVGRIASETPTLLARLSLSRYSAYQESHRFRNSNAVGTSRRSSGSSRRGSRIASETPTLLAPPPSRKSQDCRARRIASETPTLLARK